MNRPWLTWSALGLCAVLILGMMGWLTKRSLESEREIVQARLASARSEHLRLALTRMDAIGANLLVVENNRPPMHYSAFFRPGDVFTNDLDNVSQSEVLQPSPLLVERVPHVKLHFEIDAQGKMTSPQVPVDGQRDLAVGNKIGLQRLDQARLELEKLGEITNGAEVFQLAQSIIDRTPSPQMLDRADEGAWEGPSLQELVVEKPSLKRQQKYDDRFSKKEASKRNRGILKSAQDANLNQIAVANSWNGAFQNDSLVSITPFSPIWVKESLLLVRQLRTQREMRYQGVWLDVESLQNELTTEMPQEVTGARLVPIKERKEADPLMLASLPWKIEVGELPQIILPFWTADRKNLTLAWLGALLALAALCLLVRGVMRLSERRASFVSSVTHELRTPLTTFRLYSEMLAEGMIKDEAKQQEYLRTMQSESERLNHLVENVLSYARIERGTARSKFEKLAVADLVSRLQPVLQRRVDQEEAALSIEVADDAGELETDVTAVEQILFNLVDNACKYGLPESGQGHITLTVRRAQNGLNFEVADTGPGIQSHERKRLFRAFHKSAREAAHSKPGVGLGLALCRRLARALGGELSLCGRRQKGASFVLQLPGVSVREGV